MTPSTGSSSENESTGGPVRLQKLLAAAGFGSRRHCEELIAAGRVTIDDVTVRELGTTADPDRQKVRLDGELIRRRPKRYFLLNKPPGVLCTNRDPDNRPRAVDLFPEDLQPGLFSVGRLDESSEGLLLMTNDGDLANRLAHPRYSVRRTYHVQVAGRPEPEVLETLKQGLYFTEGLFRVDGIRRVGRKGNSTLLDVTLDHGQNREIRRLFARIGHKVMTLQRIRFGPLTLGNVKPGRFRPLTAAEIDQLHRFVAQRSRAKSGGRPAAGDRKRGRKPVESKGAKGVQTERDGRPDSAPRGKPRTKAKTGRKSVRSTGRRGHQTGNSQRGSQRPGQRD